MRWHLLLVLVVACREDAPAEIPVPTPRAAPLQVPRTEPVQAPHTEPPLPPLDRTLRISTEPGYPGPTKVLLRLDGAGAEWRPIAPTGREYRLPRPKVAFSIAVICGDSAEVFQLGPEDRFPIRSSCSLRDAKSGTVRLTSDRPSSFLSLEGPDAIGSLTHPEDTLWVPAEGVWDIIATDDATKTEAAREFAIARSVRAGDGVHRFTRWHRPMRANVVVRGLPADGVWSLRSILLTSNGTSTTLQRTLERPALPDQHVSELEVLVAPPAAIVPGDCMQIFVDACAGDWCRATSSCTREAAFHEGPTAPITRVPGAGVVLATGGFHDADIANLRSTGFRDDKGFTIVVTATRAWLATHAADGRFTIPVVPGFEDAANDHARYVWLALVWGLAPTTSLPYKGGAWQRATTSIDLTGGPRPP